MIIPNFLAQIPVVEQHEDGKFYFTPEMQGMFSQLFSTLAQNLGQEGLVPPPQTAANIALLTNSQPFTLVGDSTNDLLKVRLGGIFKTIQTA